MDDSFDAPMDSITVKMDKYLDAESAILYLDISSHSKNSGVTWVNRISLELLEDLKAKYGEEFSRKLISILSSRSSFLLRCEPSTVSEMLFFSSFINPLGDSDVIKRVVEIIHNDVKLIQRVDGQTE